MKVFVMFGSKSDEPVYKRVCDALGNANIDYELKVCSAHRSPDLVEQTLEEEHSMVVAGAGLAAHLPGVIASKTIKLVVGVPCDGAYDGLDALLSIVQMPPGIPVLGMGVKTSSVSAIPQLLENKESVTIIGDKEHKRVKACADMLDKFNVMYDFSDELVKENVNIKFLELGKKGDNSDFTVINVPLKDKSTAEDSIDMMKSVNSGFWVGLNRGDNAALVAIQILNKDGSYTEQLKAYRKEMRDKIAADFK